MRCSSLLLLAALTGAAHATSTRVEGKKSNASPIKYIIVLMMENRSFDHFLGHLGITDPRIDGLQNNVSNPIDPLDPKSQAYRVNYNSQDGGPSDPHHDFDSITQQVYGFAAGVNNKTATVRMDGFVANAVANSREFVMSAFNQTTLPVLSTLASQFAVFDAWHCSCPCPTNPNREFYLSGTAHGKIENSFPDAGFPQQTHFSFLEARNISWNGFYTDDPWMFPAFADLRTPAHLAKIQEMPNFFTALKEGTLAQYTHLEPRMATSATGPSNWQHPDNSVEAGEEFYSQVYTALRASKYWEESLLIITFDEHGGFSDHQPNPEVGIPAPDNVLGSNGFDYTRLGVRVPTVMISPWIAKGTVIHAPTGAQAPTSTSQFDATSIISSVNKIFGIPENMTARDAWAGTFHDIVDGSSGLRTDCPMTMPPVKPMSPETFRAEMNMFLNDHHLDNINLLCALAPHAHAICTEYASSPARTVEQAAYAEGLKATFGGPAWGRTRDYPHLFGDAARHLRQQHFEAISKTLFGTYKAEKMATVA